MNDEFDSRGIRLTHDEQIAIACRSEYRRYAENIISAQLRKAADVVEEHNDVEISVRLLREAAGDGSVG